MALTKVTGQVIKNTTDVTVGVLTVTNTLAVGGTVSIGGTLTYEDVTNRRCSWSDYRSKWHCSW